jgi:branched-chain amino acid transport system substrate-binding protein
MRFTLQVLLGVAAAALFAATPASAQQMSDGVVKIGVLNDQSGLYADLAGPGSVWAARKAVADFNPGFKVEVVAADHQNKPDVGASVVR